MLLKELCDAMRARSEAEHLYTAAAIGGFGAVAWGVAALRPEEYFGKAVYERPAAIAALGILLVAAAIVIKIFREHRIYRTAKSDQARIAGQLASLPGAAGIIPDYMTKVAGRGYLFSALVVLVAALAAFWFCLSLAGLF